VDYKSFFILLNDNITDSFIKINIIDIIGFLYSFKGHTLEVNLEICKLLHEMCLKENDMEVVSHVLNAYFDIYREDDLNINLKNVGVIELMRAGEKEFKKRVRNAKMMKELDKDAYSYAQEVHLNLKNFIKYKEDMFKKQNI
jgi:hypothetical protein